MGTLMNGGKVIMVKNKQPVVYVARRIFDKSGRFYCVGYFVSKAYLLHKETTYKKNGIANTNYTVDIGPERYEETWNGELRHMDQLLPRDVMDENYCIIYDSAETCHRVFSNYQDCYKYTGKENKGYMLSVLKNFLKDLKNIMRLRLYMMELLNSQKILRENIFQRLEKLEIDLLKMR